MPIRPEYVPSRPVETRLLVDQEGSPSKEVIFAAGNLVHGQRVPPNHECFLSFQFTLTSFFLQGILPGNMIREEYYRFADKTISFAMLGNGPLSMRYIACKHYGPRSEASAYADNDRDTNFAVIVDRKGLLAKYPSQLHAIGQDFRQHYSEWDHLRLELGIGQIKHNCVHLIPIRNPDSQFFFSDEVRLYPKRKQKLVVDPSLFLAIVIRPTAQEFFFNTAAEVPNFPKLPVYSYEIELLGHTGS